MKRHKTQINEGFLVRHKMRLTGLNRDNAESIQSEIDHLNGTDQVAIDPENGNLIVAYDASLESIEDVLSIVRRHGAEVKTGWWDRVKLSWSRQTDQNLRDNSNHHPHCCSKTPKS